MTQNLSTPLVSVIIPCYNGERFLAAAIESALNQTYPAVEVVVVNDGSKDDSFGVAHSFGARIVLVDQQNRGLSAARNRGIAASKGEILMLLDADDIFLPTAVASRVKHFADDLSIGLVAGYYREIDEEGTVSERIPEVRTLWEGQAFRQAVRRNWGPPVGWAFRREVFERVGGFDPLLKSCEDWDFVIRVSLRYLVGYEPTVQTYYRKLSGQMSSNYPTMLSAANMVRRKSAVYAPNRWSNWVDGKFGQFELGRRVIYAVLFQDGKVGRMGKILGLMSKYPYLLWVLLLSAFSFLMGKRASNSSAETSK